VGKTSLSLEIALKYGGEIISADSAQIYKGMDIGTAKLPPNERRGVPHHLIDVLEPTQNYSAKLFCEAASNKIIEISNRNHLPILVGGTGFYIRALLYGAVFGDCATDGRIRQKYRDIAEKHGIIELHEILSQYDPEYAKLIPAANTKRIVRALEYIELTGKKFSEFNADEQRRESPYNFMYCVLTRVRDRLYRAIDERVDEMIRKGLCDEVRKLSEAGVTLENTSMQAIGYKEIAASLPGEYSLEQAIEKIKLNTRHFAKRQLTWFRREREARIYDVDSQWDSLLKDIDLFCGGLSRRISLLKSFDANRNLGDSQ